jgi:lauroyl/myristoyl acyltransferase
MMPIILQGIFSMKLIKEICLLARFGLKKLELALPKIDKLNNQERFHNSVSVAFPHLSKVELRKLYNRYRMSMHKFSLMKAHLSNLTTFELNLFVEQHVRVEGQHHLDLIKSSKTPVIFVTPHYGSFPLGFLKLIQEIGQQKTVNAFYNPPSKNRSSEGYEELFKKLGFGFNALFNNDTAVLKALRVLKRGEALAMMPDVFDISGHSLYVPFFGRLIPAMAGTALFALKSNATVIVGYSCPTNGLQSTIKLGDPLKIERTGQLDVDIANLTNAIFRDMEAQIRQLPEHWIYLQGIGDLLNGRLRLGDNQKESWLQILQNIGPHLQAINPEFGNLIQEVTMGQTRFQDES